MKSYIKENIHTKALYISNFDNTIGHLGTETDLGTDLCFNKHFEVNVKTIQILRKLLMKFLILQNTFLIN
jgi:hypothetical protein